MPFLQAGGSGESDYVGGHAGSGLSTAHLIVDPDKVVALKHGFDAELVRVRKWLVRNNQRLRAVPPPGGDPCSKEAAEALGENGNSAIQAVRGYLEQLEKVSGALNEIVVAYGLTETASAHNLEKSI